MIKQILTVSLLVSAMAVVTAPAVAATSLDAHKRLVDVPSTNNGDNASSSDYDSNDDMSDDTITDEGDDSSSGGNEGQ